MQQILRLSEFSRDCDIIFLSYILNCERCFFMVRDVALWKC